VDEKTYKGGVMGADHPIAWYHEYDGGRAWYTAMGLPQKATVNLYSWRIYGGNLANDLSDIVGVSLSLLHPPISPI